MTPIELAILINRNRAICEEMGAVLQHAAFSPNIKDRLDFSCALFDAGGQLFAQAAHIPVHLGSMAYAMADVVGGVDWQDGDVLVVNDPFLGGTHLPDVTIVCPVFADGELLAFVANRAHHANIGAEAPGSMPLSKRLEDEGLIIPPSLMYRAGEPVEETLSLVRELEGSDSYGDFAAQVSANRVGLDRLRALIASVGRAEWKSSIEEINAYGRRLALARLGEIPKGRWHYRDVLDGDGFGTEDIAIEVAISVSDDGVHVDFEGTSEQVAGNVNCPLSVAAAAVFYCFRCLLPDETPPCAGTFSVVEIAAPEGCLVNAQRPAATAAGNVETSMRVVDAVLGALHQALPGHVPAASQGTMNNVAMGNHQSQTPWDYYETICGGTGAHESAPGLSAVHSHMTNTLNTPVESLEMHYPLRVLEYSIRRDSGGAGRHAGGDGVIREIEFLGDAEVTLLTERRTHAPWGLDGGDAARVGRNLLDGKLLDGKCHIEAKSGQVLRIETPGGGGYGRVS